MKQTVLLLTLLSGITLAGCAGSRMEKRDFGGQFLSGSSLVGTLGDDIQWMGTPIRFKNGDTIPMQLGLENAYLRLKQTSIPLLVTRDFYVLFTLPDPELAAFRKENNPERKKALMSKMRVLFSNDGSHWAPFNSLRDLKQVFAIQHGTTRAFLSITKEAGLKASLWFETR